MDNGRTDRLQFLKAADVVWLMVDGRQLSAPNTRQWAIHRAKLLMQRLAALVSPTPPVILVITRRDKAMIDSRTLDELSSEAGTLGLTITTIEIASFADAGDVAPGTGIRELVLASIRPVTNSPAFWPDTARPSHKVRAIMRFRLGSTA